MNLPGRDFTARTLSTMTQGGSPGPGSSDERSRPTADDAAGRDGALEDEVLGPDDTGTDEAGGTRRRRRRNPFAVFGFVLLGMALIVALVLGGFAVYLNHVLDSNVKRSALLPDGDRADRDPAAGDARNILLLGSDSRTEEVREGSRADVIQLVHIPADRASIQVIHFPRDLYVDIPGRGKNKINAAYAFGGAPLLVQTLEQLLDVRIDNVASIGFDGFKELTNTLGGVDVNVRQASVSDGHTFTPGRQHMDGDTALAFVRERKQLARGDIDRGVRQQAWIKAIMDKTARTGTLANPAKLSGMVGDVARNLVVDESFSTGDMRGLALSLRNVRGGDVGFLTAPYSGFSSVAGVGSVDVVDQPRMTALGTALRTDRMSTVDGQSRDPG